MPTSTQIVVFRRADDWRLIATVLDLRAALLGRRPCPGGEIWVSDADLIIVPKSQDSAGRQLHRAGVHQGSVRRGAV